MHRLAILIDGGHLRVLARMAQKSYNPGYVEKIAHACVGADEELIRVLYYDCAPYNGDVRAPVSQTVTSFTKGDGWLLDLAKRDLFAVRRGVLKFRGWKPRALPVPPQVPTDADFEPTFEQKGVDMRIGLDVASFAVSGAVDRLALITNDTDCVPAMKYARRSGIQTAIVTFPTGRTASELIYHADFHRAVTWPAP